MARWVQIDVPEESAKAVGIISPKPSKGEIEMLLNWAQACSNICGVGSDDNADGSWLYINVRNFLSVKTGANALTSQGPTNTTKITDLVKKAVWSKPDDKGNRTGTFDDHWDAVACMEAFKRMQIIPYKYTIADNKVLSVVAPGNKLASMFEETTVSSESITTSVATSATDMSRQRLLFSAEEIAAARDPKAK